MSVAACLSRGVPLALLHAASVRSMVVDGADEFSSGEPVCSTSDSQATCPSQCLWCVEAGRCAASWKTCELPAEEPGAGSTLLIVLIAALLCCGLAATRRNAGASHVEDGTDSGAYQLTNRVGDAQRSLGPALLVEQPEGQRLLSAV